MLDRTPVTAITPLADGMEVVTAEATFRCRRLVVTADAWTNEVLAPLGMRLPLTVTQEQVTYYASPRLEDFRPDRFPSWIWYDVPCYYGLAVYGEERGVKVAQDIGGREVTAAYPHLRARSVHPVARGEGIHAYRTLPHRLGALLTFSPRPACTPCRRTAIS